MGENAKSSAATFFGAPQSLISLKSVEKTLQIKDFIKRNWTPIKIRIVSKLVSSYGRGDGSKNSPILPFSTAFLSRIKPSKHNGFHAFRCVQLCIHNFTNWFYRVQIVHGYRNKNSRQSTPSTLSAVRLTSVRISTGATAITVYSPYTTTCYNSKRTDFNRHRCAEISSVILSLK